MIDDLPPSREEGRQAGSTLYETGKSCKHGHKAPRYVSNTNCLTCHRKRAKEPPPEPEPPTPRLPDHLRVRLVDRLHPLKGLPRKRS